GTYLTCPVTPGATASKTRRFLPANRGNRRGKWTTDHDPAGRAAANLARLSPSSTARSRPTARGLQAKRAKRPGERSERLWTHGDNRRRPEFDEPRLFRGRPQSSNR